MKLNAGQLVRQLPGELAPVYVISGDEPLLIGELADQIRQACRAAGCEERDVYHAERGFDWSQLYDASHSLSLFAQKRLIELRIPGGKPGDDGAKALLAWLNDLPQDITLLVTLPKLDGSTQRSKWAKALIEHPQTRFVQVWPVEAAQLPGWMRDRLAAAGIQAQPDALELLSARVEGNLLAAAQEIEKLKLFCQGQVLDLETVTQVVADSARYDVFGLADAMLQGHSQHALRILVGLRGEGVEAPVILWSLTRELRSLAGMAEDVARGIPLERVFASQRPPVWDKRKPLLAQALKRHPQHVWSQWLMLAQQADEQIKGQHPGSPWDALTRIVAEASGTRLTL
ncbi:DNA polymerase III, delta subunit [Halopseudomonas xinjiangensis]|uniref:DNA polymerase III subunit delta n=1 Tax=Halopseudomonas xinjiangensis TaxID=487184 RepID=A0A1H1MGF1_9GAMM|nr:DNA polymerase III subunit delta [Halopseudomonas xinjiangensis]SDR85039.1 DNA polymerase III, delta subunit [Halopseudomonas xinjiangensis]